ncbi:MAG: type II toxin-antitoxin system HicB family antitoxin [Roseiarcus sp.]
MRYPIAIEPKGESAVFGVIVPDPPGCFSAGDTLDEAFAGAEEAAAAWIDAGEAISAPDALARSAGETRSGFIAHLTLEER